MRRRLGLIALILAVAVIPAVTSLKDSAPRHAPRAQKSPPAEPQPRPPAPPRPFASTSVWNAPLADGAEVDSRSPRYLAELLRQLRQHGPYVNTREFSSPVYTVPRSQPPVHVTLDQPLARLQAAFAAVPIPRGAEPARGTDAHMTVWQPSTDTLWEFYRARHDSRGWRVHYGGRMQQVSRNPGYFTDPPDWGATGTSLPLLGGLMRIAELQRGEIPHALALSLPQTRARSFVPPAQRSDGNLASPRAIPEGTRFRLDPALDLSSLRLPAVTGAIARAAQRYGMIVRDQAGSVTLYGEAPPSDADPYGAIFGAPGAHGAMRDFPWDRLRALAPPSRAG